MQRPRDQRKAEEERQKLIEDEKKKAEEEELKKQGKWMSKKEREQHAIAMARRKALRVSLLPIPRRRSQQGCVELRGGAGDPEINRCGWSAAF